MTFDKQMFCLSDAVIIDHRMLTGPFPLRKKDGQIWIMIQHEASNTYSDKYTTVLKVCTQFPFIRKSDIYTWK